MEFKSFFDPRPHIQSCGSSTLYLSHEPHKCKECSEVFITSKGLEIHKNKHHLQDLKFHQCDNCYKKFKSKYLLKAHHRYVHQKIGRISCSRCGKLFSNKSVLTRHTSSFHPILPSIN